MVGSTLRFLNTSANRRLFDRDAFPRGCVRCAVVGNGGILNGSRQGKAIDAHDLVFRCRWVPGRMGPWVLGSGWPWTRVLPFSCRLNGAVIKGFEEDVGTKISFYGFTVNTMKNSLIAYEEYGFTQIPQAKVRTQGLVGEVTPNCPLRLGLPPKPPHLRSPQPSPRWRGQCPKGPPSTTTVSPLQDLRYIFIPSDVRDYVMLKSAIQGSPVPEGSDKGDE